MIYGIGTDIVQVGRIEKAVARHGDAFVQRILGPEELAEYARRSANQRRALRYLATRFAAKEAFSKAVGLGMQDIMNWHAMQTLNERSGKPMVVTSGRLHGFLQDHHLSAQVSISDEADYAVAFVVLEKNPTSSNLSKDE